MFSWKNWQRTSSFLVSCFDLFMFLRIMNLVTYGNLVPIVTKTNSLIIFQTKKWVYTWVDNQRVSISNSRNLPSTLVCTAMIKTTHHYSSGDHPNIWGSQSEYWVRLPLSCGVVLRGTHPNIGWPTRLAYMTIKTPLFTCNRLWKEINGPPTIVRPQLHLKLTLLNCQMVMYSGLKLGVVANECNHMVMLSHSLTIINVIRWEQWVGGFHTPLPNIPKQCFISFTKTILWDSFLGKF